MTPELPGDITLGEVYRTLCEIKEQLKSHFVSKEEHESLKDRVRFLERIVFGFCGLIIVAVVIGILGLVVRSN